MTGKACPLVEMFSCAFGISSNGFPERGLLTEVYNRVKAFCMCCHVAFQEGIPDGVPTQAWGDPSAKTVEYAQVFNFGKEWRREKGDGLRFSLWRLLSISLLLFIASSLKITCLFFHH